MLRVGGRSTCSE